MISYNNKVVQDDLKNILSATYIDWQKLEGKTVLITGVNGMLATYMAYVLAYLNEHKNARITILAGARNIAKAETRFLELKSHEFFNLIYHDVNNPFDYDGTVDYIIHAASNASPRFILEDPVGIIKANTIGTMNLLEFAKDKDITNFLFLSTREIYGKSIKDNIDEQAYGAFDILESRACYPESKRMAETMMQSYYDQFGIPFTIARLAHSYGPGMEIANDGRIMSDLLNNVIRKEDIVLKSDGSAERAFCYLADAVTGLFTVLLNGDNGQAYNIANEESPIMIRELAELLVSSFPERHLNLVFDIPKEMGKGYSKMGRTQLDTSKLEELGWKKDISLEVGIKKTIESFEA
ncbi:NAD-dependent epimerase/dehydratase family protein [Streptococcus pluranimalium]|uniref:NAD-dependent epimerase/dehydratase family protein n=1 Tax=Streptococcus pluranimalium TaxID=82348 RepID=UPI00292FC390|nr:NAD-dependent epimerase/dehydratase family protein [Streptococcus pluranimalium]